MRSVIWQSTGAPVPAPVSSTNTTAATAAACVLVGPFITGGVLAKYVVRVCGTRKLLCQ